MPENNVFVNKPTAEDYLQWDIFIWGKALMFWSEVLEKKNIANGLALEIGSKDGGLSLFLANVFKFNVICSDINGPTEKAKELHKKFNVGHKIEYKAADALNLNFENNSFDVVIFKSVLGSIGRNDNFDNQAKAIAEIYRILKPNGILLFAENAKASFLHTIFRKIFRKWASYWRYVTIDEMLKMLNIFKTKEIHTAGYISAFVSNKNLKKIVFPLDSFLEKITTKNSHYVLYGYAVK